MALHRWISRKCVNTERWEVREMRAVTHCAVGLIVGGLPVQWAQVQLRQEVVLAQWHGYFLLYPLHWIYRGLGSRRNVWFV